MLRFVTLFVALTTTALTGCVPSLDGGLGGPLADEPRGLLVVSADPIDAFTCVPYCSSIPIDIELRVEGDLPVTIDELSIERDAGLDAWWIEHEGESELAPGEQTTVTIRFDPQEDGMSQARLLVWAEAEYEVDAWTEQGAAEIELFGEAIEDDVGCRDDEGDCG